MAKDEKKKIIIKKIIGGHGGGHHGGAWKVAYADFVTAMMAFFLLLWLLNSIPQDSLKDVAQYFSPTVGIRDSKGIGLKGGLANTDGISKFDEGTPGIVYGAPTTGSPVEVKTNTTAREQQVFTQFRNDVNNAISSSASLKNMADNVLIQDTPEGLMITLADTNNRTMFVPGTNTLQPYTKDLLAKISSIVRYVPNYIAIRTHTLNDSGQTESWGLSSDRSLATRSFLLTTNIDPDQIARVEGEGNWTGGGDASTKQTNQINMILLKDSISSYKHKFGAEAVSLKDGGDTK